MNKLMDRIVDVVDEHADGIIRKIENILFFFVFLFIFAFGLHLFAIAISERGGNVTIPRYQRNHPQGEINNGTGRGFDLDRQGMGIRAFEFKSGAEA